MSENKNGKNPKKGKLQVKVVTYNKGQPTEHYGLAAIEQNGKVKEVKPLNYAPKWKTKAGAERWARKNGYDLKDSTVTPVKGKSYRQKVNSQQGYEDWEYTGKTRKGPNGTLYAFTNDLGTCWFDDKDIKETFSEKKQNKSKSEQKKKTQAKAPRAVKKADKKLQPIKHDDKFERGAGDDNKIIIVNKKQPQGKRPSRRELKRIAKTGGYTVFDGARTGKTFETPEEAALYAADVLMRTGEKVPVMKTDRQVTHTFKAENGSKQIKK